MRHINRAVLAAWFPWITMIVVVCACGVIVWHEVNVIRNAKPPAKRPVVVVDLGHPSGTNSARRVLNGTTELQINWDIAQRLAPVLEAKGIEAILTKNSRDEFVSNKDRAIIANDHNADLTIHLHCDAGPGRGYTLYYPDRQGEIGKQIGPSEEVIESSAIAAEMMHSGMQSILAGYIRDRGVKGDDKTKIGSRHGALTTSVFSEVPTVTVEMVFLSNKHDADFIKSDEGQVRMTAALTRGIEKYLLSVGYEERDGRFLRK